MRSKVIVLGFVILMAGAGAWGQMWAGFDDYPGGHLLMTYRITLSGGEVYTYTLELTPVPGSEEYTVRTEISGKALLGDVQATPYLLFAWEPGTWFGSSWWLSFFLSALFPGQPLVPNHTYVFPGGFSFVTQGYVEIAGVKAIKGVFSSPQDPSQRVVLAISPDPAVPYPVLIREETRAGGDWKLESELILTKYEHGE